MIDPVEDSWNDLYRSLEVEAEIEKDRRYAEIEADAAYYDERY